MLKDRHYLTFLNFSSESHTQPQQWNDNETEITAAKQQSFQNLDHPDEYIEEGEKKKMAELLVCKHFLH